jgi:4-hydroxysphinganine ceramide fatty acyl 2-hydroxylase
MPARILPTLTAAEVAKHNSEKSCYVTLGANVYDVTDFLDSHPGGAELVLEYAGKDVGTILKDEVSHEHSEAAYEILDDSLVAFLVNDKIAPSAEIQRDPNVDANDKQINEKVNKLVHPRTGMSCEEDLSKDTDLVDDYKKHKFLDLNKPLLLQVWNGGFSKEFYLDQVHRPRHYKGGASAPLFGNFLEPLSLTPWWMVPTLWMPVVLYCAYTSYQGLGNVIPVAAVWCLGLAVWTLIEYVLHRCLFHLDE